MKNKTYFKQLLLLLLVFTFSVASSFGQTCGDIDTDGSTDIIDALLIAQCYVGITSCPSADIGDVNCDGSIDIIDGLLISQLYVGLISTLNCCNTTTDSPVQTPQAEPTPAPTMGPASTPSPDPGGTPNATSGTITQPPSGTPMPEVTPDPDETNFFYFSYDDSASTASVELAKYQLNNGVIPDPGLARPWEFLNFETFNPATTSNTGLFNVSMGLWERDSLKDGYLKEYKLGVYCASPVISKEERNNVVLTILVDVSGSMGSQSLRVDDQVYTRMDLVHYGLNVLPDSLKEGDVINIATFNTTARIVHQGLQWPTDSNTYFSTVEALGPTGSTNLAAGIDQAYQAALATYDPEKTNRVIILTDAYANTGQIDPSIIAQNVIINNQEGIYFSGLGISQNFNEAFLNELTDAGKGAYFSIITLTDAQKAFKDRFIALLSIAAKDVQFRMDYPSILEHDVTAAEETSGDPAEVQPTNFSYNTSQYFFEGFLLESGELLPESTFKLTITYLNPGDGTEITETCERTITELLGVDINLIQDAETIFLFTKLFGLQKTWGEISPVFTTYYSGYSSPIYTEYTDLMRKFLGDDVTISPNPVDFGSVLIGNSLTQTVTIANNTMNPLEIYNISVDDSNPPNPFSIDVTLPSTIPTMGVLNFQVHFTPDSEDSFSKSLMIDWSYTEDDMNLTLSGTGITATSTPTPTPEINETAVPTPL